MSEKKYPALSIPEVIKREDAALMHRRQSLYGKKDAEKLAENRFGIALSGGGIRSATINLGFLKTLNRFDILKRADYLSTVSGGGYCGSYIQTTLKNHGRYDTLFAEKHIQYMRRRGEYLFPGKGLMKVWNQLVLAVGYLFSLAMSLLSPLVPLIIAGTIYLIVTHSIRIDQALYESRVEWLLKWTGCGLLILFALNYIFNQSMRFNLTISAFFHRLQTAFVGLFVLFYLVLFLASYNQWISPEMKQLATYLLFAFAAFIAGFFTNPNATSFHRFYRHQLADTFLHYAGAYKNVSLKNLFDTQSERPADYMAPYPLINTCLNLISSSDPRFKGTKASDYFLLSPQHCGSKLTGYVKTDDKNGYNTMTLPAAITISAAAINPGMGIYSNKILSILTTLFNARLGYWTWNPLKAWRSKPIVWWPVYFFYELFGKIGTENKMLNISDGGHIENLAVYELLRRRCRLIIAVDAGEDAAFAFTDLENLTVRARNELGIEIRFPKGNQPEENIRPRPSFGYSQKRHAIADLLTIWEEFTLKNQDGTVRKDADGRPVEALVNYFYRDGAAEVTFSVEIKGNCNEAQLASAKKEVTKLVWHKLNVEKAGLNGADKLKFGTLVYVKSSVTAPKGKPDIPRDDYLKYGTYKYRIYHPDFPHEPTSDQFFDEIQWEAYYQLGQYIGAEILGIPDFVDYQEGKKTGRSFSIELLLEHFDEAKDLFKTEAPTPPVSEADTARGVEAVAAAVREASPEPAPEAREIKYEM